MKIIIDLYQKKSRDGRDSARSGRCLPADPGLLGLSELEGLFFCMRSVCDRACSWSAKRSSRDNAWTSSYLKICSGAIDTTCLVECLYFFNFDKFGFGFCKLFPKIVSFYDLGTSDPCF